MPVLEKTVKVCICNRCKHEWTPKLKEEGALPKVCSKCHNPYWNSPRTRKFNKTKSRTKKAA